MSSHPDRVVRPDVSVCDGAIARWVWGEAVGTRRPIDDDGSHQDEWAAIDAGLLRGKRRTRGAE